MKIAVIQIPLVWEDAKSNWEYIEQKINTLEVGTDLIVLPEMFTTGFTMSPERVAETMQGDTVVWMQSLAKAKNCAITGSLVIIEDGKFYNRLLFVFPSGAIQHYNKRHLFSLAGEDKSYTKGTQKLIIEYKGWKICPLICYDLRFPVFARNVEQYDLLLYVANWPTIRMQAWDTLLKARAVENMSYVIGCNRVGQDEKEYDYSGHSQVVDFLGNYRIAPQEAEGVFYAQLEKETLLQTRTKLGFLNDQDAFEWK
jgi:predicted amidohydrolase